MRGVSGTAASIPSGVTAGMALTGVVVGVVALYVLMRDPAPEPSAPYWTRTRIGSLVVLLTSGAVLAAGVLIASL